MVAMPKDARALRINTAKNPAQLQQAVNDYAKDIMGGGATNYADGAAWQVPRHWSKQEHELDLSDPKTRYELGQTARRKLPSEKWREVYQSVEAALNAKR